MSKPSACDKAEANRATPAGLQRLRADRETISVPESERSDENGRVILSRVIRLCPAKLLYIKEGVGKQASAPKSAGVKRRLARERSD